VRAVELEGKVLWMTIRRLKPGTSREEFNRAWRPGVFPEGMVRAYECWSEDGNAEVVGISIWESAEARERFRRSDVESARRQAMAAFVAEETSGIYSIRELTIPQG
jgi:hypothetical protein